MMERFQLRNFNTTTVLLFGVVLGLVIGLLIGWVLWPVSWQGAMPNELFPDAKAQYLAAVAEAYLLYDTPEAAETARQRVASFGDNLAAEIEAAVAFYSSSNDPAKEIHISNLGRLAAALGVSLPGLVGLVQAAPATSQAPPDTALPTATEAGGIGWLRWILYFLLAVMLLLGGIYLLLQVVRGRRTPSEDEAMGAKIDQEIGSLTESRREERGQRTYVAGAAEDEPDELADQPLLRTPWRPASAALSAEEQADYSFEDEPDDLARAGGRRNLTRGGQYTQFRIKPEQGELTEAAEDEEDEEDWDDTGEASFAPSGLPLKPAESGMDNRTLAPTPAPPPVRADPPRMATSLRTSKYKLLEVYTAHYQSGIHDYDEAHPIIEPATGKYIGECGMGASTKNGLLQNYPDQVIALEVWLFDKADDRNINSQTRVLLSEYAIDHNLDQAFLKDRQDDPRSFTAQPNVDFQLESQSLYLECRIKEVIYVPSGPTKGTFQSVKVEMAVHRKN